MEVTDMVRFYLTEEEKEKLVSLNLAKSENADGTFALYGNKEELFKFIHVDLETLNKMYDCDVSVSVSYFREEKQFVIQFEVTTQTVVQDTLCCEYALDSDFMGCYSVDDSISEERVIRALKDSEELLERVKDVFGLVCTEDVDAECLNDCQIEEIADNYIENYADDAWDKVIETISCYDMKEKIKEAIDNL
jgi:hypothetical protein